MEPQRHGPVIARGNAFWEVDLRRPGGGAFFAAKANIEQGNFTQAINRIIQDTDAGWCDIARGQIAPGSEGSAFCAIHMP